MDRTHQHQADQKMPEFRPGEQRTVHLELNDGNVIIRQSWDHHEDWFRLGLAFSLKTPQRFGVRVFVPEDSLNACATLNGQYLLGWFASEPQPDIPELILSPCAEDGHAVTPLKPGCWQTVNFRWQNEDQLIFYFVQGQNDQVSSSV